MFPICPYVICSTVCHSIMYYHGVMLLCIIILLLSYCKLCISPSPCTSTHVIPNPERLTKNKNLGDSGWNLTKSCLSVGRKQGLRLCPVKEMQAHRGKYSQVMFSSFDLPSSSRFIYPGSECTSICYILHYFLNEQTVQIFILFLFL